MQNSCEKISEVKYDLEQLNEKISSDPQNFIDEVETNYRKYITNIANSICSSENRRKVLMLSGPSSSGKTTTAKLMADSLFENFNINTKVISLDDFYRGTGMAPQLPNGKFDYEDIEALDIKKIHDCLFSLVEEGYCDKPVFNFDTRMPEIYTQHISLAENDMAIVEGLHAINPIIFQSLPREYITRIYISVNSDIFFRGKKIFSSADVRFLRRIVRDYYFRSASISTTISMWNEVRRGEKLFIEPFKRECDLQIESFHPYELSIIAKKVIPLIASDSTTFIKNIKDKLRYVKLLTKEFHIPETSLLREFVPFD